MGIIADLKFVEKDKRFVQDKYVQALGGINRIKQFLSMDKQFITELNFYIRELENPRFWASPNNIVPMELNLKHLEASLNKEYALSIRLMEIAKLEQMGKELRIFTYVTNRLINARMDVEGALLYFSNPRFRKENLFNLKSALKRLEGR